MTAAAQDVDKDKDKVERITITGSSIKRLDAEGALPVTVIKAEEFVRKGMQNDVLLTWLIHLKF